jgi:beta-glucosidase
MVETHFRYTSYPPDVTRRANELLLQMTLEEKVGQMVQEVAAEGVAERVRAGRVGSVLSLPDPAEVNRLQHVAVEETRLHIPLIFGFDVIHGERTVLPIPLAEACTWNPALIEEAARMAATEAVCFGVHWIFAPMVDICRDPRWGRIAEGAGEDPTLGAAMARARVRGFQAHGLPGGRRIVACPKHYVGYGAAEAGKDYSTTDMSERTLRDVYLPPFKAAFDEGAGSTMSAFNEISGVPASANSFILKQVLRDEWGWPGVVVSDYNAIAELIAHGLAADLKEAAAKAALAGVDMDMMGHAFSGYLIELVRSGAVSEALVDAAVRRILELKLLLGLFEQPYTDESWQQEIVLRPEHREKALAVAREAMVLLRNKGGLLPLSADKGRLAVIGPLADDHKAPLGCWAPLGRPEDVESVLDGLRALWRGSQGILYERGCEILETTGDEAAIRAAVAAAQHADGAVVVLGESAEMSGEAHSRAHLGFPGKQQKLLEAVVATGKPVVLVVLAGRPLLLGWASEHVTAILEAWHGGIRTGRAVAEILFGQVNPSGKLAASFPRCEGQIPLYYAHKNTGRPAEGAGTRQFVDPYRSQYLDESNAPLYPFGYGLSYSRYVYERLAVHTATTAVSGALVVEVDVRNSSERAGDEIVQLYVRDLVASVTRPVRELKAFCRVPLAAGERRTVRFEVRARALGFHGLDGRYRVEPGRFKVWVGPNSAEGLEGEFEVR